ncbi:PREDICTED: nucleoside-triphosphatase THEP1 [Nicrophorus vespilloides]|uniref:Nucleoside-triphosphatase THEP1 n=1 Tax=Nicrophorus vespilloides TaxID=110193 RepID=A0ABM1MAP1_NICVS|nr:PREDICTED: nucleoside-triphosphatase THEP1 [Nicrophorus vespilloides]
MSKRHVLITGLPGVGKTTIVKKLCKELQTPISGFYTEEVRDSKNVRIGFDVVSVDESTRGVLARISDPNKNSKYTIGKYQVYLTEFEDCALLQLQGPDLLVIDEIGKMEMFSSKFKHEIELCFKQDRIVIATVPLKCNITLVEQLKKREDCQLFTVDKQNRNHIFQEILQFIKKINI